MFVREGSNGVLMDINERKFWKSVHYAVDLSSIITFTMAKVASLVFFTVLGCALAAPAEQEPVAIVAQESDIQPDGSFKWSFESADGVKQEQTGQPKQIEQETPVVLQGSASWTDGEGNPHQLTYVADENGYQPQSADIPQAPEIPAAIARALEYNAAHPEQDEAPAQ